MSVGPRGDARANARSGRTGVFFRVSSKHGKRLWIFVFAPFRRRTGARFGWKRSILHSLGPRGKIVAEP
ncbi:MAG: hypothetical protein C3F11_21405 [Methylocystaceae bacterium]|nr:MAG: hypothetical protein C3F11_21405 [Methylocystaceae bacterium]